MNRWSQEQGQPLPYNGDRSFYNLIEGGSADRVLPILVRRIACNDEQGRVALNRIMEVDADAGVNTIRILHLESSYERTQNQNATLQRDLTATQVEIRELRAQQAMTDRRMRDMERRLSESRTHSSGSRRR